MLNWLKQFLLSFVKYHTVFGDNLRKKQAENTTTKNRVVIKYATNCKILLFHHFYFLTILQMPSWCQMLNCLNNSCSVLIMLFRNFYFLAISAMPCWRQMLNWLKQFRLSFVKYHTVLGDNLRKD